MSLDNNLDRKVSFPGFVTLADKNRTFNYDDLAAKQLAGDARLAKVLADLKGAHTPYVESLKEIMKIGDDKEEISTLGRITRAGDFYLGRAIGKLGIGIPRILRPETRINLHSIHWVDSVVSKPRPYEEISYEMHSTVYFEKGGDTADPKILKGYAVDILQPGNPESARLVVKVAQDQEGDYHAISQKLSWVDNARFIDRLIAYRMNGEEFHRSLRDRYTPVGEFCDLGYISYGGYAWSFTKGEIETTFSDTPNMRIKGELKMGRKTLKWQTDYLFNKDNGRFETFLAEGAKPNSLLWSTGPESAESNTQSIMASDVVNFQRAALIVAPSTIPADTYKAFSIR